MSDKDLDKLFKNKLEEYEKAPKRDLWADIDEQLPQKNNKGGFWIMSIAASILILITIGISFYINTSEEPSKEVIAKKENPENTKVEEANTATPDATETDIIDKSVKEYPKEIKSTPEVKSKEQKQVENPILKKSNSSEALPEALLAEKSTESSNQFEGIDQSTSIAKNLTEEATSSQERASTNKQAGSTITFDINDLGSKEVLASNNPDDAKKESKLKQLFKMAKDLKEGESGISDLREAKNELFAMNFRKNEDGK